MRSIRWPDRNSSVWSQWGHTDLIGRRHKQREGFHVRDEVRRVLSGSCEIATRVVGNGPLVILMHGWPELGQSWRHQVSALADAGFTVAIPDMRGFGASSKPDAVEAYRFDLAADDMAAIADFLGHRQWISVGHDAGSMVAWRTALRFPDRVAAVFSLSVPYLGLSPAPLSDTFDIYYPDNFFYMRYFQEVGRAESELEADVRGALKRIYFSLSGDAPLNDWISPRPIDDPLLSGLAAPPAGPLSFMSDEVLGSYTAAFEASGFFGSLSWYRNFEADFRDQAAYGDGIVRQPSGYLCGEKEILLAMFPGALETQRSCLADMRREIVLPGAGHWIQQERSAETTEALLDFLLEVKHLVL
jgi:pimeloyl-ACP methyl ester carboxylesterase